VGASPAAAVQAVCRRSFTVVSTKAMNRVEVMREHACPDHRGHLFKISGVLCSVTFDQCK
jgi:hypothetical protein